MEQELTVYQEQAIGMLAQKPSEALAQAGEAAQALKAVIAMKPKPVIINGQQYLELEDWQTIGRFYGLAARVVSTSLVHIESVMGWEATADVVHVATGKIISSGMSMCLNDEDRWGDRPLFQLRSMAQTRACSKAFRNCLAWVVVMAGYRPTPAEEMTSAEQPREAANPDTHFYKEHNTRFLKTAKTKAYAHPIGKTDPWRYEHTEQAPVTAPTPQGKSQTEGAPIDPRVIEFKNQGEFYAACHNILNLAKSAVDTMIPEYDVSKPEQRKKAWLWLLEQKKPDMPAEAGL